ncbi:MAG: hypothetical protein NZZ60_08410 [Bacteroidia bacterium]|nr:hypothetical protein [Bacteroidia bacterium]MCX7651946.1 hypothetical protein [Bacteroidia bacterium]MDW8416097.1 hypothetical protein [Bacteroidia bacterium]
MPQKPPKNPCPPLPLLPTAYPNLSRAKLFYAIFSVVWVAFGDTACTEKAAISPPKWWEYAADSHISRFLLLGRPLYEAEAAEASPYYKDSLGYTFLYAPPLGGKLWVEYYAQSETIRAIALLWEADSFAQMTQLYQLLKGAYTERYGTPEGVVGDLKWQPSENLRLVLRLSPERRYLHANFSLLSLHEDLYENGGQR